MSMSVRRRVSLVAAMATLMSLFTIASVSAAPPGENGPIVFVVPGENAAGGDLYVIGPDGSGEELVASGVFTAPDVSPDGSAVLVTELDDPQGTEGAILSIDLASGDEETLVESGASSAAWSGDGSAIAYAADGLWVMEGDAEATEVAGSEGVNEVWDWSPVDDRVLVTRSVGGPPSEVSLETIDVETGDAVVINDNEGGVTWFVSGADFAPDGDGIVYTQNSPGLTEVVVAGEEDDPIAATTADGAPVGPVTWSPDDTAIAFMRSTTTGGDEVVIHTVASGAETSFEVAGTGAMDWSPVAGETPGPSGFTDVPTDHTFYSDIVWLAGEDITRGCNPPENTLFCPDEFVTRGQMAAFLVRGFGYSDDGGGDHFEDDDESIFEGDIDRLATADVTRGCNPPENDMFCPTDYVTRAQMAAFLARAFANAD